MKIDRKKEAKRLWDIAILELMATYTAMSLIYPDFHSYGERKVSVKVGSLDKINAKIRALKNY